MSLNNTQVKLITTLLLKAKIDGSFEVKLVKNIGCQEKGRGSLDLCCQEKGKGSSMPLAVKKWKGILNDIGCREKYRGSSMTLAVKKGEGVPQ